MKPFLPAKLALILALLVSGPALAAPPQTINYQGYLTNPGGTAINAPVTITFRLYNTASGGMELWSETQSSVPVTNGVFNAVAGAINPITLPFDETYWLSVAINADPEMSPRQPLASSPYAFRAAAVDSAASIPAGQISGSLSGATLPANQISSTLQGNQISGALVLATIGGTQITGDIVPAANIVLGNSTASSGNIFKNSTRFIHNFGVSNFFAGSSAGNFTLSGAFNTAVGVSAMQSVTSGVGNSAFGASALAANTSGNFNAAFGNAALAANVGGANNTAIGTGALSANNTGSRNIAIGRNALSANTSGNDNIIIGSSGSPNLTTGDFNIYIGGTSSTTGEASTIRIGINQSRAFMAGITGANVIGNPVSISPNGQLGIASSSRRFKDDIADMSLDTAGLMRLRPVTFHYKSEFDDGNRPLQYGLIAEEVDEIFPSLVARDVDGSIQTVRYHFLAPMLLAQVQKQQRTIDTQEARIERLERALAAVLGSDK